VRPVTIRAGVTLRTLMEAGNIVLAAPARHQMRRDWQTAASKADARCPDWGAWRCLGRDYADGAGAAAGWTAPPGVHSPLLRFRAL